MASRLTERGAVRGPVQQISALSDYLEASRLEPLLIELISLRASQINGCAYCLSLHAKGLREGGEREDRLHVLSAWKESGWFTPRERAALAWTEAVTTLEGQNVPDDVYELARTEFDERDLSDLTLAVIVVNAWNRLNIALMQEAPVQFSFDAEATSAGH